MTDTVRLNPLLDSPLPDTDDHMCFRKQEFDCDTFSVDRFVTHHQQSVPLEQLNEQLAAYLRTLRIALADLLDRDCERLVQVASHLIGLDRRIDALIGPLVQIRNQLSQDERQLSDTLASFEQKRKQLHRTRSDREHTRYCEQIARLLNQSFIDEIENEQTWHQLEEYELEQLAIRVFEAQLKLSLTDRLSDGEIDDLLRTRLNRLAPMIEQQLCNRFSRSIESNTSDDLCHTLETAAICHDRLRTIERHFVRQHVQSLIRPFVSDASIERSGVSHFFSKLIALLSPKFDCLFRIQSPSVDSCGFILRSLWAEVVEQLCTNATSLFQAGDPDRFHEIYLEFNRFAVVFSQVSQIPLDRLTSNVHYRQIKGKFNTKIYFHMRVRDILRSLDDSSKERSATSLSDQDDRNEEMQVVQCTMDAIARVWSNEVYIDCLFADFWKFTLQIVFKHTLYLKQQAAVRTNVNVTSLRRLNNESAKFCNRLKQFCIEHIIKKKPNGCNEVQLIQCLNESLASILNEGLPALQYAAQIQTAAECEQCLQQVRDVPRLFRKTNRSAPTLPSPYAIDCGRHLQSIAAFNQLSSDVIMRVLDALLQQLQSTVCDVLTSLMKMEQSLKRLKKIQSSPNDMSRKADDGIISDEDKIRLQLKIDVEHLANEVCTSIRFFSVYFININLFFNFLLVRLKDTYQSKFAICQSTVVCLHYSSLCKHFGNSKVIKSHI